MPLSDIERLDAERVQPRLTSLHFLLQRLRTVVSFMHTGAHPDDEVSAMLAVLGFRHGLDLSYACANRGEGGQNDIGTEAHAVLGTLRTAEMEAAAGVLNLRLYWLSQSPDDTIFDFGFSKSGDETLQKWGRERTLQRFVHIVRRERPDILCPTFLDVPGQHGHHRAMTALAHEVMDCAADPLYTASTLPVWSVKKLYLPAWGGGDTAYDDEIPPPPASLEIKADDTDEVTGWSWENIGQHSRRFHRTQNMGRWVPVGTERNWPLHLVRSRVIGPDVSLLSGLPHTLADLAGWAESPQLKSMLEAAQQHMDAARSAFPHYSSIANNAIMAIECIRKAKNNCPASAQAEILHRLERKERQLSQIIKLALGISAKARLSADFWLPGDSNEASLDLRKSGHDVSASIATPAPWTSTGLHLSLDEEATLASPYPDTWLPDDPAEPALKLTIQYKGVSVTTTERFENPPIILPAVRAQVQPEQVLLNTQIPNDGFDVTLTQPGCSAAAAQLTLPDNWCARQLNGMTRIHPPSPLTEGLYEIPVMLDNQPAFKSTFVSYPHVPARIYNRPATLAVRVLDIQLPNARLAYVGGGNDTMDTWLEHMGLPVRRLTDAQLSDTTSLTTQLNAIDTLVVGLFAYKTRPALAAASKLINAWINEGGHLLTLYHRPWDNWNPEHTPPRFLEIGQPSLRYRVTNENAEITHLIPDHPLLNHPNIIKKTDWDSWDKERGLYFPKHWDSAYNALLSMSDPNESPHTGALLCANIGKGRHVHTSLILHHQMNKLVPGSFRLMANLVS